MGSVMYCRAMYCSAVYCSAMHCSAMYSSAMLCSTMHFSACIAQYHAFQCSVMLRQVMKHHFANVYDPLDQRPIL
jgi:hypothetical protein